MYETILEIMNVLRSFLGLRGCEDDVSNIARSLSYCYPTSCLPVFVYAKTMCEESATTRLECTLHVVGLELFALGQFLCSAEENKIQELTIF